MPEKCPECGAPVMPDGDCMDNFYAMLYLESEVPAGTGDDVAHFYAVASYGLQHPASMGYTAETVEGLRSQVEAMLTGSTDLESVRRAVRAGAKEQGRVTRRGDERAPHWSVESWPLTVQYVLEGGVDEYCRRVEEWARSIVETVKGLQP